MLPWVLAQQCHGRTESFPWLRVYRILESFPRFRPAYFWAMLYESVLVFLWHSTCISGMVTRVSATPCSNLFSHIHLILGTEICQSSGNHEKWHLIGLNITGKCLIFPSPRVLSFQKPFLSLRNLIWVTTLQINEMYNYFTIPQEREPECPSVATRKRNS